MCKWEIRFLEMERKYTDQVLKMTMDKIKNGKVDSIDIVLKIKVYTDGQTIAGVTELIRKAARDHLLKKTQLELF